MLVIRGVNIFPGTMEEILRSFSAVGEYRITATREGEMDQLRVELEEPCEIADEVAAELQLRLGLRIDVSTVAADSLPRFEAKAQRFVDQRG
jgi:phenylacetate-CoA ligase